MNTLPKIENITTFNKDRIFDECIDILCSRAKNSKTVSLEKVEEILKIVSYIEKTYLIKISDCHISIDSEFHYLTSKLHPHEFIKRGHIPLSIKLSPIIVNNKSEISELKINNKNINVDGVIKMSKRNTICIVIPTLEIDLQGFVGLYKEVDDLLVKSGISYKNDRQYEISVITSINRVTSQHCVWGRFGSNIILTHINSVPVRYLSHIPSIIPSAVKFMSRQC